jgi:hypothetical protein
MYENAARNGWLFSKNEKMGDKSTSLSIYHLEVLPVAKLHYCGETATSMSQ